MPENLHITLQFLGSVTDTQYQQLVHTTPACQAPSFTLHLDRLGYFPKAQVLWIGARETPPALQQIVHCLGSIMTDCGLQPDTRPYHAHLTLQRKVKKPLLDFQLDSFAWPVTGFVLVRSDTRAEGVKYDILHQWSLQTTD